MGTHYDPDRGREVREGQPQGPISTTQGPFGTDIVIPLVILGEVEDVRRSLAALLGKPHPHLVDADIRSHASDDSVLEHFGDPEAPNGLCVDGSTPDLDGNNETTQGETT